MRFSKLIAAICVIVLLLSLSVVVSATNDSGAIVMSVQTQSATLTPGQTVQVSVNIDENAGSLGINFDIKWDAQLLEVEKVDKTGSAYKTLEVNQKEGKLVVTIGDPMQGIMSPAQAEKVTATGKVLDITFKPKSSGELSAQVTVERASFVDMEGKASDSIKVSPLTIRYMTAEHTHTPGPVSCVNDQTCTVCGAKLADKQPHQIVNVPASAPNCSFVGWEAYEKCANCDYSTYVEIPVAGVHNYGPWEVVKEATQEEQGRSQRTCSVCKVSETALFSYQEAPPQNTDTETAPETQPDESKPGINLPTTEKPAPKKPSWVPYVVLGVAVAGFVVLAIIGKKKEPGDDETLPD